MRGSQRLKLIGGERSLHRVSLFSKGLFLLTQRINIVLNGGRLRVSLPGVFDDEKTYRTLQLFTEESNACTFILSEEKHTAWPIAVQLSVEKKAREEKTKSEFCVSLLRFKGGGFE